MNIEPIKLNELSGYDELIDSMIAAQPIKNLNRGEALNTIRMFEISLKLGDTKHDGFPIDVYKNDKRMVGWSDNDKFLALLIEHDQQDLILTSNRLVYCFGKSKYYWRKIGRTNPVTTTASAISECSAGYYGRGWVVAPHIKTLYRWFVNHPATKYFFGETNKEDYEQKSKTTQEAVKAHEA